MKHGYEAIAGIRMMSGGVCQRSLRWPGPRLLFRYFITLLLVFGATSISLLFIEGFERHQRCQDTLKSIKGIHINDLGTYDPDNGGKSGRILLDTHSGSNNSNIEVKPRPSEQNSHSDDGLRGSSTGHQNVTVNFRCSEKRNLAYIKQIKCASQTLASIFRRFGYTRNLEFVLPVEERIYIGWPYLIEDGYYRPSKSGVFNILCAHSVYNSRRTRSIMPPDTMFITGIREPFSQVRSMFHYYRLESVIGITEEDSFAEYLTHLEKYEAIYKSPEVNKPRRCVPAGFSMSRNLMSYILGFPTGFLPEYPDRTEDEDFIKNWIESIEEEFDLVMIVEYFLESLVLLKRKMCWDFRDIIHLAQNQGSYTRPTNVNQTLVDIYRRWSRVDYALYENFNRTFWSEIDSLGQDFTDEVDYFRSVMEETSKFCHRLATRQLPSDSQMGVTGSKWSKPFELEASTCRFMATEAQHLIKDQYDRTFPLDVGNTSQPDRVFC